MVLVVLASASAIWWVAQFADKCDPDTTDCESLSTAEVREWQEGVGRRAVVGSLAVLLPGLFAAIQIQGRLLPPARRAKQLTLIASPQQERDEHLGPDYRLNLDERSMVLLATPLAVGSMIVGIRTLSHLGLYAAIDTAVNAALDALMLALAAALAAFLGWLAILIVFVIIVVPTRFLLPPVAAQIDRWTSPAWDWTGRQGRRIMFAVGYLAALVFLLIAALR